MANHVLRRYGAERSPHDDCGLSKRRHVTDLRVKSHDLNIDALTPDKFRRRVEAESEGQEKTSKSGEEGTPLTNNQLHRHSSLLAESISVD